MNKRLAQLRGAGALSEEALAADVLRRCRLGWTRGAFFLHLNSQLMCNDEPDDDRRQSQPRELSDFEAVV
jgi:hypothetical protein